MMRIKVALLCAVILLASATHGDAQKLERAVLAYGSTGANLTPFWVARDAGVYRQYGLDVETVFFRGSTIAINALATRDAHFGSFGASSAVLAKLGGVDTVVIATAAPGLLFYLIAKPEIKNAADLRGKKNRDQPAGHRFRSGRARRRAAPRVGRKRCKLHQSWNG